MSSIELTNLSTKTAEPRIGDREQMDNSNTLVR